MIDRRTYTMKLWRSAILWGSCSLGAASIALFIFVSSLASLPPPELAHNSFDLKTKEVSQPLPGLRHFAAADSPARHSASNESQPPLDRHSAPNRPEHAGPKSEPDPPRPPTEAESLAAVLFDTEVNDSLRMKAAADLARIDSPEAYSTLLRAAYSDIDSDPSEPVLHEVLRALVRNHYASASGFVEDLLDHPQMDAALKTATLDAMAGTDESSALSTLLRQARNEDPTIREAAIWAILGQDQTSQTHSELTAILATEPVPWVRASLYEVLRYQDQVQVNDHWEQIAGETDLSARIKGYELIATHLTVDDLPHFESEIVPELRSIAQEDSSVTRRISAIVALGRAEKSADAQQALRALQENGLDPETRRAAKAARHP